MNLEELRSRFRSEVRDNVEPYFASDEEIDAWMNEAQEEACRRALLLVDSTSAAATAAFLAGAKGVDLHASVIFVRRAILAASSIPLQPVVSRTMDEMVPGWEGSMDSVPRTFVPDWQTGYLRFWPPALDAGTVKLTVVRTPLLPMVGDGDKPEIRPQYHAYLLDWAKFRYYSTQDADSYDPKKADKHEVAFIKQFGQSAAVDEHWSLEQYYDIGAN